MKTLLVFAAVLAVSSAQLGFGFFPGKADPKPTEPTSESSQHPNLGQRVVGAVGGVVGSFKHRSKSTGSPATVTPATETSTPKSVVVNEGSSKVRVEPQSPSSSTPVSTSTAKKADASTAKTEEPTAAINFPTDEKTEKTVAATTTVKPADLDNRKNADKETTNVTDPMEICRQKWQEVSDPEKNKLIDVLDILLEYGGLPGMVNATWQRNTTNPDKPDQPDPDRWTYFYGDTDYKSYVRIEKAVTHSKDYPKGQPETVKGDIYWSPPELCGKMRHANYVYGVAGLEADQSGYIAWIADGKLWRTLDVNCVEGDSDKCGRGGLNSSLMASLVG